jgi:hypothetical protein
MTVPIFKKMLSNLDGLLSKGALHATEKGMDEQTFLDSRLAPDMFPLLKQITIATDNAKGCAARLAGIEVPVMDDTETTVAELHERIAKTISFLDSLTPEQFSESHSQIVHIKYFPGKHFIGHDYLTEYALPNFFFHVTTAYGIIRSLGTSIGKTDYIGALTLQDA